MNPWSKHIIMNFGSMLRLQKCLYINGYISVVWMLVTAFFIYEKFVVVDHLSRYLSVAVYSLLVLIEVARLYLGNYGNLGNRVPELAGFLMLTILMQLPLVSFFLFNTHLLSTPTEVTLHCLLWVVSVAEVIFGFFSLKRASDYAKMVYLSQSLDSR